MIKLDARLQMLAGLIVPNRKIVDVGTDHGFLPAFVLQKGLCPSAIASDVAKDPLKNAEKTLKKYKLQGKMKLVLSDGLKEIPKEEAEEIILAGMGGTLMVKLLSQTEWLKEEGRHLILQPMTRAQEVREYLCDNGFYIDKEVAVFEGEKVYGAISAYWTGEKKAYPQWFFHFGKLPLQKTLAAKALMQKHKTSLKKRRDALILLNDTSKELETLNEILRYYKENIEG